APRLADRADRARALAEERAVRLPVDLLVLEADERDRRVGALLERATLPAVDQVGPVHARLAGGGDAEAAHHPAAGRAPSIRVGGDGRAVPDEAVGRRARRAVGIARIAVRDSRPTDGARQVRAVVGVADAEDLGVLARDRVAVDPLVGVRVARIVDVAV